MSPYLHHCLLSLCMLTAYSMDLIYSVPPPPQMLKIFFSKIAILDRTGIDNTFWTIYNSICTWCWQHHQRMMQLSAQHTGKYSSILLHDFNMICSCFFDYNFSPGHFRILCLNSDPYLKLAFHWINIGSHSSSLRLGWICSNTLFPEGLSDRDIYCCQSLLYLETFLCQYSRG